MSLDVRFFEEPTCGCAVTAALSPRRLHRLAHAAQQLRSMLHAADIVSQAETLTDMDRMTLDGLIIAARDYADDLVMRIDQLTPGLDGQPGKGT